MEVSLLAPTLRHQAEFLRLVRLSRDLHRPWVSPPRTAEAYQAYVRKLRRPTHRGFLVRDEASGEFAGVVNLNEIVRGALQSAYLGYYAFAPSAASGRMRAGMAMALDRAFGELALHRVEANIQPENHRSIRLVQGLGFRREGFSPRYLRIGRRWCDHERWALLREEWSR